MKELLESGQIEETEAPFRFGRMPSGECYRESAELLMFLETKTGNMNLDIKLTLVHASVVNSADGEPMGHAWVEASCDSEDCDCGRQVEVYDAASQSILPKDMYYRVGGVDPTGDYHRYTHAQMLAKLAESEHWGPWDLEVER